MMIKQLCAAFIATLLVISGLVHGQAPAKTNEILPYFDKIPAVSANTDEAYARYYPKGKVTPAKEYGAIINEQINLLANLSDHKSSLLSMLRGVEVFEKERKQYNFIKAEEGNKKDKELDIKFREINSAMLWAFDDFNRSVNHPMDSIYKLNLAGMPRTTLLLQLYQKNVPALIKTMKKYSVEVTNLLEKKGYNNILDKQDITHPYYIQLLEIRSLVFDRIRMINQVVEGINVLAAQMVDICSKNPDACK